MTTYLLIVLNKAFFNLYAFFCALECVSWMFIPLDVINTVCFVVVPKKDKETRINYKGTIIRNYQRSFTTSNKKNLEAETPASEDSTPSSHQSNKCQVYVFDDGIKTHCLGLSKCF